MCPCSEVPLAEKQGLLMTLFDFPETIVAHLHVHVVGGDELGAAEEHGDPEEQHNLQLPAAIVAHNLGNQG